MTDFGISNYTTADFGIIGRRVPLLPMICASSKSPPSIQEASIAFILPFHHKGVRSIVVLRDDCSEWFVSHKVRDASFRMVSDSTGKDSHLRNDPIEGLCCQA